jgi:hypothetical protein
VFDFAQEEGNGMGGHTLRILVAGEATCEVRPRAAALAPSLPLGKKGREREGVETWSGERKWSRGGLNANRLVGMGLRSKPDQQREQSCDG